MSPPPPTFIDAYHGYFRNLLRWDDLDQLWQRLSANSETAWYLYLPGEAPPTTPLSHSDLLRFIRELDLLLRREHDEEYCGIVYADNPEQPAFIKIYDPNNLGSVCGSSGLPPPLPGWILSQVIPVDLPAALPPPANRRRWWQQIFS
jgi:hypothetical protein